MYELKVLVSLCKHVLFGVQCREKHSRDPCWPYSGDIGNMFSWQCEREYELQIDCTIYHSYSTQHWGRAIPQNIIYHRMLYMTASTWVDPNQLSLRNIPSLAFPSPEPRCYWSHNVKTRTPDHDEKWWCQDRDLEEPDMAKLPCSRIQTTEKI